MKKQFFIFSLILICALLNLNAQTVSFGIKAGYNLSNFAGDATDTEVRFRGQAGFLIKTQTKNPDVLFQSGILLTGKGASIDLGEEDKDAIVLNYVEVPLNWFWEIQGSSKSKFQLFAGPYVGFCYGAKYKYLKDEGNEVESLKIGMSDNDDLKPIDAGFNLGFGIEFENYQLQLNYGRGIVNLSNYEDEEIFNSIVSVGIAYFFFNEDE